MVRHLYLINVTLLLIWIRDFPLEMPSYLSAQIGPFEGKINNCFCVADFISSVIPQTFNHVRVNVALV